jgi:hypothetical protein
MPDGVAIIARKPLRGNAERRLSGPGLAGKPAGVELLLQETIAAAQRGKAVKSQSLERISIDTTMQPKAIANPLDSRLYHRGREILVWSVLPT